ncbi:hypothetical protein [Rathayibacter sp. VKM Ac-2857]|nr:hypothetical protein [Rathayibacter sp. VKM Ac-2857]NQX18012.1 hypothetical protein [Rathayibacter sp. VKM Ac-2857]
MSRSRIIALLLLAATTASTLVSCTTGRQERGPSPHPDSCRVPGRGAGAR